VRTGLPRDTYKTAVQYDGNPFNPFSNESDDGLRAAVKFGFRSKALSLQVKLAERLQLATDPDKRFLTMQQAFEEVIRIDRNFSLILADIKEAYDEKVELVASKDSDAVSLAAYEALRNRERMAAERNEALQDEVHMLRELAAQGNVARKLVEDHDLAHLLVSPRSDASQDEACKAASAAGGRGPTEMGSELQRLQAQVAELQAALEDERTEKGKLKSALEEVMRHKSALHLPLLQQGSGAADTGPSAAPSVRDTARSACSGYDDHPTHRSLPEPAARPSFVHKLTDDEWAMVQRKREEEEAENAAWDAQQQQQELNPYAHPAHAHYADYDPGYDMAYGLPALGQHAMFQGEAEYDDDEERQLLEQYHRHLAEEGQPSQRSGDSEREYLEQGHARPESRSGYYPGYRDEDGRDTQRTTEGEEEEGDSYSASDGTIDPSESMASSFVDSARQAEEEGV